MKKVKDADPDVAVAGPGFVEEFNTKPTYDEDGVQATSGIGKDGKEYPDPVPMAPPVGFDNPPDLMDMMATMLKSHEVQKRLEAEGFDTFEEAGDFDVDDDPLPRLTMHEALMMPPAGPPAEPPPPPASPQVEAGKEGGGGGPSQIQAPPAPSEPAAAVSPHSTVT